jgi:hypothetical protein
MTKPYLITLCRRCKCKWEVKPGLRYLSDYCETCQRFLGVYTLAPERQAQMAANYRWQLNEESKHRIITPFEYRTLTQGASRPFSFGGMAFKQKAIG